MPDAPTAEQQQRAIEAALALSYAQRPDRNHLMEQVTKSLGQATDFVRAHDLVTMPDAPAKLTTMPKFQQGYAVAYDDPPGALERGLDNFFAVSPVPDDWTDAQATSFLSEYNNYMIQDLAIHEAMPGHYLQLFHSNQNPSVLRAVLAEGVLLGRYADRAVRIVFAGAPDADAISLSSPQPDWMRATLARVPGGSGGMRDGALVVKLDLRASDPSAPSIVARIVRAAFDDPLDGLEPRRIP